MKPIKQPFPREQPGVCNSLPSRYVLVLTFTTMCAVFPWVAFGLAASVALADSAPSSYSDFVKSFSACGQLCMDTLYSKVVGDSCGDSAKSSTRLSDIKCICTAGGFKGSTSDAGDAGECYAEKCGSDDMSSLADNMNGFIELCRKDSGGSGMGISECEMKQS